MSHLLSVVLLPDDGLPTRPIRGSRGILGTSDREKAGYHRKEGVVSVQRDRRARIGRSIVGCRLIDNHQPNCLQVSDII
jgi:hypothetical protein